MFGYIFILTCYSAHNQNHYWVSRKILWLSAHNHFRITRDKPFSHQIQNFFKKFGLKLTQILHMSNSYKNMVFKITLLFQLRIHQSLPNFFFQSHSTYHPKNCPVQYFPGTRNNSQNILAAAHPETVCHVWHRFRFVQFCTPLLKALYNLPSSAPLHHYLEI